MWDLIRKDPILKSISIFIVGIFSFAFAFSIMFGAGQGQSGGEHDHASTSAGYSAATGLGEIIIMLSKLLIIILLIAIIIMAVKFIQKHVVGNETIKGIDYLKSKPLITILVGIGGILVLLLAINLILPSGNGNEVVYATSNIHTNSVGFGLAGILAQLLKIVAVVSSIGLVVGLGMYFKERYFGAVKVITLVSKEICNTCGLELKGSWKCCPSCGTEKNNSKVNEIIAEDNGMN